MKLREHAFLADQNFRLEVVAWLQQQGCDAVRCADIGLERELDSGVLRWALDHGRILLTHDTDFGELATLKNEPAYGIVLLRPGHGDTARSPSDNSPPPLTWRRRKRGHGC